MEPEQLQNFNERLSQWVSNQGFWFQVRYSMSGSGMKGRAVYHLLRLGFRLLVFLLIIALGCWVYLLKRTDTQHFRSGLQTGIQEGLSASELEIKDSKTVQGQLEISRVAAEGGKDSFFSEFEARIIHCEMGLLDGLFGSWDPGILSISKLDIDLRAGADDSESAGRLAAALFRKSEAIELNNLEVESATLRWGYSDRTRGSIESSTLKMQRSETGWRMIFKGGTFNQSWMRSLEIETLVVLCEPSGLLFEKAELKQGAGTVNFSGLKVIGGERPEVKGTARIKNLPFDRILPSAFHSFIEGSISGDFRMFGSTNSSDGVGFEGQVVLGGDDVISLRDRIHLLKALSVVDYFRKYKRIDFREGSFRMKTIGGGMEISELKMKAEDIFTLEGRLKVRLPTAEEIQASVAGGAVMGGSALFADEDEAFESGDNRKQKSDFTLKRAAREARLSAEGGGATSGSLFDRLQYSLAMRQLQSQASERMSRMLRYDGNFLITIPGDAFERARLLEELYPVNAATGRISMRVPIEGNLYELTLKQAEDLYLQGER